MRQKLFEPEVAHRWRPLENVTQVGPGFMPVHACGLHNSHDNGGALASEFATHELPCFTTHGVDAAGHCYGGYQDAGLHACGHGISLELVAVLAPPLASARLSIGSSGLLPV